MITPELVGRMLNTVVEGLAVAACVWLALRWIKPLNSETRFVVWFSTLLAIVALPFLAESASREVLARYQHARLTLPSSLAFYLFIAWAVIAVLLLARLGVSLWHVRSLRKNSLEIDPASLDPTLQSVRADASSRRIQLRVSDHMRVPAALGFFRPAIMVPSWALRDLPADELKVILLHELAHLRRWDDWTNLAQKVVKALFFFHPAVWWIEGRLTLEREMACDEMVLAHTTNAKAYARSLLLLAERIGLGKSIALAQAALGRAKETSLRITQILDGKRSRATGVWKPALGIVIAMSVGTIVAIPYAPNLVTFEDQKLVMSSTPPAKVVLAAIVKPEVRAVEVAAPPARENVAVPARAKVADRTPKLVQASAAQAAPVQQMLVVMESVQYDESGLAVWTLCVWQITKEDSKQQLHPEVVMKSL